MVLYCTNILVMHGGMTRVFFSLNLCGIGKLTSEIIPYLNKKPYVEAGT